ncbi:hypothetical protein ACIBEJ_43850 [Nonomuraea sp. NPDC050790]|uniref:hypothetical protein n=1 Tax=Nonomuraea sp. NPDC050790 TaxID=3364371 RepID=UPI0037A1FB5A
MSGLLVGAVFGAVFVVVNAQEPLGGAVAAVLRVLACLAAAGVGAMWFMAVKRARTTNTARTAPRGGMFGKGYLVVVAAEVVLLFGGLRVLTAWEVPVQANVAWVAFVVGVHFVALAPVWKDWTIAVPGAVLTGLGVAGLVMAGTAGLAWVPFVSGVLSGVVLLAGSLTSGWRELRLAPAGVPGRA